MILWATLHARDKTVVASAFVPEAGPIVFPPLREAATVDCVLVWSNMRCEHLLQRVALNAIQPTAQPGDNINVTLDVPYSYFTDMAQYLIAATLEPVTPAEARSIWDYLRDHQLDSSG